MTEAEKRIREALAARLTPGPWVRHDGMRDCVMNDIMFHDEWLHETARDPDEIHRLWDAGEIDPFDFFVKIGGRQTSLPVALHQMAVFLERGHIDVAKVVAGDVLEALEDAIWELMPPPEDAA